MGGLFGGSSPPPPEIPKPPEPKPPAPLPDEQSPAVREAELRAKRQALAEGSGRRSTILSSAASRGTYSKSNLGP